MFNQKAYQELAHMRSYTGSSEFSSMRAKYQEAEASRGKLLEDIRDSLGRRRKRFKEKLSKRRFDEYWATHQSEKEAFESERKSLFEQISVLDSEISTIPQKTEGYSTMLELQKKVENLASEKKALSFFKAKEKKAIQEQIDSINNDIVPIQSRINSAIEEIRKRISPLQNRIKAIDTELTKPRGAAAADGAICPACGATIIPGWKFCNECGAVAPDHAADGVVCPACGKKNPLDAKFCTGCGGKLEADKRICACGAELAPSSNFCTKCGAKL